jgi:hypothetical protein
LKYLLHNKIAYSFICIVIIYLSYSDGVGNILAWDIFGHYIYLPLLFDHKQLVLQNYDYLNNVIQEYNNTPYLYQFVQSENGDIMTKYTSGWAVLMSPFYGIAKIIAHFTSYKNDGFSYPFQLMISIGGTFYTCLGIYYVQKILNYLFNQKVAILSLIILVFGTNFLFTNYINIASSNNIEFTLVAAMLWYTIRFHKNQSTKNAILLGISFGLIGLVRPPDLILIILPIGWNIGTYGGLKPKIVTLWRTAKIQLVCALSSAFLILFIQAIYWKLATGDWITNSYSNNPGEGLDWFTPYLFEVLFSFRKGWFLYTPIMIFACYGLFRWSKQEVQHKNSIFITFFIFLYVISCWTTWWYAESYSQRALIDIYAIMAIGIAWFIASKTIRFKKSLAVFLAALCIFNLFQTYQMDQGIIHASRMTSDYYFSILGQTTPPSTKQLDLLLIDRNKANETGLINKNEFKLFYEQEIIYDSLIHLSKEKIYTPALDIYTAELTQSDYFWVVTTWKYKGNEQQLQGKVFNACGMYKMKAYQYSGKRMGDPLLYIDSTKNEVTFHYLSPEFRTKKDPIRISIWHQAGPDIDIESIKVQLYEPLSK